MRKWILIVAAAGALGACSAADSPATDTAAATEEMAPAASSRGEAGSANAPTVTVPKLAYSYTLGFALPGDKLTGAQEAHRKLCTAMGPAHCQLLALERGNAENSYAGAMMRLRVATAEADQFSARLSAETSSAGGRTTETHVEAEDVSKAMVDAEARIHQRELLVERLTQILRTGTGKVSELLEAERSVTQAQEELDQARAWLTELRGRVAMSNFEIHYAAIAASTSSGQIGDQLGAAAQDSGTGFLIGLRAILVLLIYLLPWLIIGIPAALLVRWVRRKRLAIPTGQSVEG